MCGQITYDCGPLRGPKLEIFWSENILSAVGDSGKKFKALSATAVITINVPLILKMQYIIFLRANYFMGHLKGYFERAKTF